MKFFLITFFLLTSFSSQAFPMLGGDAVKPPDEQDPNETQLHQQTDPGGSTDQSSEDARGEIFPSIAEKNSQDDTMSSISSATVSSEPLLAPASSGANLETPAVTAAPMSARGSLGNGVSIGSTTFGSLNLADRKAAARVTALPRSAAAFTAAQEEKPQQQPAIKQVSTPAVRAEEAVKALEDEEQIARNLVRTLKCIDSAPTMEFLRMLDVNNLEEAPGSTALWSVNTGDPSNKTLLLNNDASRLVKLFIPEENDQPSSTITSPITFQGAKSSVQEITVKGNPPQTISAPNRIPTAEENRELRKMVHEAFDEFYGHINNQELQNAIQAITSLENIALPMKVRDVIAIFSLIPEQIDEEKTTSHSPILSKEDQELLAKEIQNRSSINSELRSNTQNFYESLTESEKYLATALYHSAETIARAGGVATMAASGGAFGVSAGLAIVSASYAAGTLFGAVNPVGALIGIGVAAGLGCSFDAYFNAQIILLMNHNPTTNSFESAIANAAANGISIDAAPGARLGAGIGTATALADAGLGFSRGLPIALSGGAASFALRAGIRFGIVASHYFKPGEALQKARESLVTLSQHEEQAPQVLGELQRTRASHEEAKTSLQSLFQRLRENLNSTQTAALASASSSAERPSAEETEKNIRILNDVEKILVKEIDHRIAETQDLAIRVEQAIQRRAAQKKEHTDWKGTNPSDGSGPRYRRPGV